MKLSLYPDASEYYEILVSIVKKKMRDNYLLFILSRKVNGNISPIKCQISDTHLFGLLKLMKTILYPQKFDQKQQKQNQKSTSKKQYETIEKMISVQKEKQNMEKQIDIKTDLDNK
ncbi:unnamed protein product [Adineta steineri]|uniref:Uncharacterized protein n=1 Tax=Adineta steineri TaxID=433720 RepID=A0A815MNE3_9BILA|nr:unnamed protein product [Adineta steineri]CAF1622475.1 unnamed protein product [Adineta steineri]